MYKSFQQWCERILRIPPEPAPPPGDEASARIFRAAPNFFRYLAFTWAIGSAVALIVLCAVVLGPLGFAFAKARGNTNPLAYLVLIIPAVLATSFAVQRLFSLAVIRLDFEKRWYVVTDRSMRIREGVLNIREMTITFANIQNISISQGPLQRFLKIADLQVDTAGGGGGGGSEQGHGPGQNLHTGWLRGIDNATEVRELIQTRIKHLKDTGLGDSDDAGVKTTAHASSDFISALREVEVEAVKLREAVAKS